MDVKETCKGQSAIQLPQKTPRSLGLSFPELLEQKSPAGYHIVRDICH